LHEGLIFREQGARDHNYDEVNLVGKIIILAYGHQFRKYLSAELIEEIRNSEALPVKCK
jgi:hypothetical protein